MNDRVVWLLTLGVQYQERFFANFYRGRMRQIEKSNQLLSLRRQALDLPIFPYEEMVSESHQGWVKETDHLAFDRVTARASVDEILVIQLSVWIEHLRLEVVR